MPKEFQFFLRLCLLSIGAGHPFRLLAGISGGFVVAMLAQIGKVAYPENAILSACAGVPAWNFIALGIFLSIISILMANKRVPERPREVFDIIDEAKSRNGITDFQHRQAYSNVIDKVVSDFTSAQAPSGTISDPQILARNAITDASQNPADG